MHRVFSHDVKESLQQDLSWAFLARRIHEVARFLSGVRLMERG